MQLLDVCGALRLAAAEQVWVDLMVVKAPLWMVCKHIRVQSLDKFVQQQGSVQADKQGIVANGAWGNIWGTQRRSHS